MKNKTPDESTGDGKYIVAAPIVSKSFVKKNGQPTGHSELYLQRSIQDYYIKFCESSVTRKELENYLDSLDELIKVAQLEVEFRDGYWDICDDNYMQQSRVGEYVVIHRIISNT